MEEEKKEKKLTTNEKIKEIEDSINDIKLRITLLKPEISHELTQRNREFTNQMQNSINNFFEQAKKQRETLQQDATQIFEKAEFIKEFKIRIHKYIEEEIRVALSEKDRAELTMIVDLERNDLGRVCSYGSVRVTEKRVLESYATVHHGVATVEGDLHEGRDLVDLLKASFPGGSITGAPKIRAMEIIEELEPTKRALYTGAIGWLGFDGDADLNIAIRTLLVENGRVSFQVGGGIVADSDPAAEYKETLDKGLGMCRSLGIMPE